MWTLWILFSVNNHTHFLVTLPLLPALSSPAGHHSSPSRPQLTCWSDFLFFSPVYGSMIPKWKSWRTSDSAHDLDAICLLEPCTDAEMAAETRRNVFNGCVRLTCPARCGIVCEGVRFTCHSYHKGGGDLRHKHSQ